MSCPLTRPIRRFVVAGMILLGVTIAFAQSPQYDGHLGHVNAQVIDGWAWDAARPTARLRVDLSDGTHFLGSVVADRFGQDLVDAGKGDGRHHFVLPMPAALRDGETHLIYARYGGTGQNLWDSGRPFTFELEAVRLRRRVAGLERTVVALQRTQRAQAAESRSRGRDRHKHTGRLHHIGG